MIRPFVYSGSCVSFLKALSQATVTVHLSKKVLLQKLHHLPQRPIEWHILHCVPMRHLSFDIIRDANAKVPESRGREVFDVDGQLAAEGLGKHGHVEARIVCGSNGGVFIHVRRARELVFPNDFDAQFWCSRPAARTLRATEGSEQDEEVEVIAGDEYRILVGLLQKRQGVDVVLPSCVAGSDPITQALLLE